MKQKRGNSLDENKLIRECQKGKKESFNELIIKYYQFVLKFLIKLTENEEISQDLVQETFLKLIKNIEKYDVKGKASFSTYLIKIAKNTYIDYLRKNQKISSDIDIETLSDSSFIEEKIIDKNEFDIVLKEIEKLPFEQAEAIKLKYMEEYSLKEIAEKMGTKEKTVKSRIHDGKEKIKKKLKKGGGLYG